MSSHIWGGIFSINEIIITLTERYVSRKCIRHFALILKEFYLAAFVFFLIANISDILDGRIEHCLLLEFFTDKGIGTAIIADDEEE